MLVLSRRSQESICIGDDIRVTVVKVKGNRVSLGIEAPAEVPVHRFEVERCITAEARDADSRQCELISTS